MKKINKIIVHYSAYDSDDYQFDLIKKWHMDKGWKDIGYHYLIEFDGTARIGRSILTQGAHSKFNNHDSIGICLAGKDNIRTVQKCKLIKLVKLIRALLGDDIPAYPHCEFSNTLCPGFDLSELDL